MTQAGHRSRRITARVPAIAVMLAAVAAVLLVAAPAGAAGAAGTRLPAGRGAADTTGYGATAAPEDLAVVAAGTCPGSSATCAGEAGASWLRVELPWSQGQPQPPAPGYEHQPADCPLAYCYWDPAWVDATRDRLHDLTAAGITPVVVVAGTPAWAAADGAAACSPPADPAAYAGFLGNLVAALGGQDGAGVRYWQIWNEPDLAPEDAPPAGSGCWGDRADPKAGGGRYAAALALAARAVRDADDKAEVVLGGLALACSDCAARDFLEGVLDAGGSKSFDVLDYHAEITWVLGRPDPQEWSFREWTGGTSGRGLVLDKLAWVRKTLAAAGAGSRQIMLGDVGMRCLLASGDPCPDMGADPSYTADQAGTLVRTLARGTAAGLLAVDWSPLGGERGDQSELVDTAAGRVVRVRPALKAMRFWTGALDGATAKDDLSCALAPDQPACRDDHAAGEGFRYEGYRFCKGTTGWVVAWSNDRTAPTLTRTLAEGATAYDPLGTAQTGPTWSVEFTPVLVREPDSASCGAKVPAAAPVAPPSSRSGTAPTGQVSPDSTAAPASSATALTAPTPTDPVAVARGPLPFTGATILPLAAAGLILLTAGVLVIRSGHRRRVATGRRRG
jgi:hypothetical protein